MSCVLLKCVLICWFLQYIKQVATCFHALITRNPGQTAHKQEAVWVNLSLEGSSMALRESKQLD